MLSDCLFSSQNHRFTDQPSPPQQQTKQQTSQQTKQQDQWRSQHKLTKMSQEDAGEILEELENFLSKFSEIKKLFDFVMKHYNFLSAAHY